MTQKEQLHIPYEYCAGPLGLADLSKEPEYEDESGELFDVLTGGPFYEKLRFSSEEDWNGRNWIPPYVKDGDAIILNPTYDKATFEEVNLRSRSTGLCVRALVKR